MREIVFDTETTGFYPESGDKVLEIGAIELENHIPTGNTYHQYINPQRDVPEESYKIHGLSRDFLKDFPIFKDIAQGFLDFIGDSVLIAHNAAFDVNFINHELKICQREELNWDRVIDTLAIAKKTFPGAKNNLDALCRRFHVDNTERTTHGALLDADLLAQVYLELLGGKEPNFMLDSKKEEKKKEPVVVAIKNYHEPRDFPISAEEETEHQNFLTGKLKNAVWNT